MPVPRQCCASCGILTPQGASWMEQERKHQGSQQSGGNALDQVLKADVGGAQLLLHRGRQLRVVTVQQLLAPKTLHVGFCISGSPPAAWSGCRVAVLHCRRGKPVGRREHGSRLPVDHITGPEGMGYMVVDSPASAAAPAARCARRPLSQPPCLPGRTPCTLQPLLRLHECMQAGSCVL